MKIFKMIRGFLLKRSRSYKIMQNVIFHVKLLSPTLNETVALGTGGQQKQIDLFKIFTQFFLVICHFIIL